MAPADPSSSLPGNAHEVEAELARRVFRLACGLGIFATLSYAVVFALNRVWWLAACELGFAAYLALIGRHAARHGKHLRGLSLLAWPLFFVLAAIAVWQRGVAGAAVWWIFTLPLVLLQGGATRSAVTMAAATLALVTTLTALAERGVLPAPTALPMGDTQRALSMLGALLFALLLTMLSLRWRRELIAQLDQVRAAAAEAMQVKSRFLANMSHEIRTPLNGIVGAAELLRSTPLDAGQQHLLGVLDRSTAALMALVNDVLDFSKLEAGRMRTESVAFDLHEAVHDAAEVFAAQAQAKGVELSAHCARELPRRTVGDPARLRQILHNLLANAVKFTSEGEVHLVAAPDIGPGGAPWVRVSVRDTGIGMDDTERQHLFEAFAQGDVSTTRRFGGSGLGLAISRDLAALLGGHIEVASLRGRGSTFVLLLPLVAPADAGGASADAAAPPALPGLRTWLVSPTRSLRDDLLDLVTRCGAACEAFETLPDGTALARAQASGVGLVICDERALAAAGATLGDWAARLAALGLDGVLLAGMSVRAASVVAPLRPLYKPVSPRRLYDALRRGASPPLREPARMAAPAASERIRCVLLAEDNPVNQLVAQGMLERLGLEVTIAADGAEALRHFERSLAGRRFDLVLMDCHMPELDGLASTRRLRRIEAERALPRTPVVALTAASEAESVDACRAAGMDDFLPKPVAAVDLERVLARWMP